MPTLRVVAGRAEPMALPLARARLVLGRGTASDLALRDDAASRTHAEVLFEDGSYIVHDLGSANGVFLDGERVDRAVLTPGCRLKLGSTEIAFAAAAVEVSLAERLALLDTCSLFADLEASAKQSLAQGMTVRLVPKDAIVLRQGAPIDSLLFVRSGAVRLTEINDEGGERLLGRLVAGDVFGERALLPGQAGRCALVADSELCLLELPRPRLDQVLAAAPERGRTVIQGLREKLSTDVSRPAAAARPDGLAPATSAAAVVIVGDDRKVQAAKKKLEWFASAGKSALVVGAIGTGKRTFARHYHATSPQRAEAYLEVSLAELEPTAVEGALFGVEAIPGGSAATQAGYLELLGGGTLVVAHAERLEAHLQAKLATYLKLGWFHRQYGQLSVQAKTRVLLLAEGTEAEVLAGLIEPLRAGVGGSVVALPTLAQRGKDVVPLAEHYLALYGKRAGKRVTGLDREAADRLITYAWPGNLAELENVMQRAVIVATQDSIVSSDLIFVTPSAQEAHKLNLLRNDRWRALLTDARWLRGLTWFNILFVAAVIWSTLRGGLAAPGTPAADFGNNFGMLLTWLVWFPLLPLSAFVLGRFWCGICPISGVGELAAKVKRLDLPVPKLFRRLDFWMVAGAFVFLDYIEEFAGVADKPLATFWLLVIILGLSAVFHVLFERKAFCRYLCPLASLLGSYAGLAPLEVRGNKKVCQTQCGKFTCYKGSEGEPGCPLSSYPASINSSYECMMCGHCLRSCKDRGVQVNLRPPLSELWRRTTPVLAMSLFAVTLVGLMGKHQFGLLTFWQRLEPALGWTPGFAHSVQFVGFALASVLAFLLAATLSAGASQETVRKNAALYGVAFVPLAFSGHLAHLAHELLGEGVDLLHSYLLKLWGALVHGAPVGTQEAVVTPLVAGPVLTFLKFLIVCAGLAGSIVALVMIARRSGKENVFPRLLPHLLLLAGFWIGYLVIFTASTEPPTVAGGAASPPAAVRVATQEATPGTLPTTR